MFRFACFISSHETEIIKYFIFIGYLKTGGGGGGGGGGD